MGTEFQFYKMKRAMELDDGHGCTILKIFKTAELILKNKDGKFYIKCILYLTTKKKKTGEERKRPYLSECIC